MYTQKFIPTKENHTIEVPKEFYGKEILITVVPLDAEKSSSESLVEIEKTFAKYRKINMQNFVFDKEEANKFDE